MSCVNELLMRLDAGECVMEKKTLKPKNYSNKKTSNLTNCNSQTLRNLAMEREKWDVFN